VSGAAVAVVREWCAVASGAEVNSVLFRSGHLATVLGLSLSDGREVVVKVRPDDVRVRAVTLVQNRLFEAGYPCPQVLAGPSSVGHSVLTAETFMPAGTLQSEPPPIDETAALLAQLVRLAGDVDDVPALAAPLPWLAWDHGGSEVWPTPDDLDLNLNHPPGPAWLEVAAIRIRRRLSADRGPRRIGHGDWEAHNLGWEDDRPTVVYDWDSLVIRSEPALAGAAATVFPSRTGGPIAATLDQSVRFLDAYQRRTTSWDADDLNTAWAAGLWVLLFNARKELAGGGRGYIDHLHEELATRLAWAGT
jgi:hypothetical protein